MLIDGAAAHEHGDELLLIEPVAERGELILRPTLIRPVRAHGEHDVRPVHGHVRLLKEGAGNALLALRHLQGKLHLVHATADGARHIKITFHDMPLRVRADDGARNLVAELTHIAHAELHGCFGQIRDGRRLEETLQVQHGII